jgi:hypothetical protein
LRIPTSIPPAVGCARRSSATQCRIASTSFSCVRHDSVARHRGAENSSSSSTPRLVSRAAITAQTQTSTSTAAAQERTRLATPSAQADIDIEEKAAADPKRARGWVAIKGRFGGGTYFVNRTSPTDIVVRAEIMLIPTGTCTANDVKAIKGMEDAIEKAASTKGYRVDLKFVDVAGPYTFKVNVDPSRWEVVTNW